MGVGVTLKVLCQSFFYVIGKLSCTEIGLVVPVLILICSGELNEKTPWLHTPCTKVCPSCTSVRLKCLYVP